MQTLEDAQEESGWKLVHGDVFRPPSFSPMLLSVMCGTGMQVLAMTLSTITFAFLGFLSPANRFVMGCCAILRVVLLRYLVHTNQDHCCCAKKNAQRNRPWMKMVWPYKM